MAVRVIVQPPAKVLTERSNEIDVKDDKLTSLLLDLNDTLMAQTNPKGVGLSAPQLGENVRVFVARPNAEASPIVMVNPQIIKVSKELTSKGENRKQIEGCLSIPDMYGEVARSKWIEVEFWTTSWNSLRREKSDFRRSKLVYDGFLGRVFQHEYDHLDGVLFTMRVLEQGGRMYKLEKEDDEEVLVEIKL